MSMTMPRTFAMLAMILLAILANPSTRANAATLSLVGSSAKICQLTGDTDWATNLPTAAQTQTRSGLVAVDLGFPVDSGERALYLLFGDSRPTVTLNPVPPDDALGVTTRTAAPDPATCLDLQLVTAAPGAFAHPTVAPPILQGAFNVPSGGVFVGDTFYAFFWTDHCALPVILTPMPAAPLSRPAPSATCPEAPTYNSIGRSVLARAKPRDPAAFTQTDNRGPHAEHRFAGMPSGFVYTSAAQPAPHERRFDRDRAREHDFDGRPDGIPVFGVPRYRASIPYLAIAPHATFGDPDTWRFFAGGTGGHPTFITRREWESGRNGSEWAPPPNAELYADSVIAGIDERCIGEHSVTWNSALRAWLLLYVCGPYRVEARTAPEPWGPWSEPTVVLSLLDDPGIVCTLIMNPTGAGCPGLASYWAPLSPPLPGGSVVPGVLYASFVMDRFTKDTTPPGAAGVRQATIYWLVSTWNPYQVAVMQSTLRLTK
jgi:hypothetical protein